MAEIKERLGQESLLFGFKFTLVGAILTMLFVNLVRSNRSNEAREDAQIRAYLMTPMAALFFWAAVITSGIIDTRIQFHIDLIVTLGDWIRTEVEPALGLGGRGWEHYLRSESGLLSAAYPLLKLNVHLLTIALYTITAYLFSDLLLEGQSALTSRISGLGSSASFVVFFFVGVHIHRTSMGWVVFCALVCALGIVLSLKLWRQ